MTNLNAEYGWKDELPTCSTEYVLPAIRSIVQTAYQTKPARILDVGCGNGYVAASLAEMGHNVTAVDASPSGIDIARSAYPGVKFEVRSIYDDELIVVMGKGNVDCVISLEVVEHLFFPGKLFEQSFRLLKNGGHLIVSTPYHGYLKNLAISLVNGWDRHFSVEWDGGHIKFFSKKALTQMACSAGFRNPRFQGVGRLPGLWKSIIMIVQK
jgi:2-polyprenyl-3-methyl-5-hydroxy-6-metoxy-1,4-benzoquinol methylase